MNVNSWLMLGAFVASALTLLFSTLTYSLRDFSRPRLSDAFERRGRAEWAEPFLEQTSDFIFTTAVGRLFSNMGILIFVLELAHNPATSRWLQYLIGVLATGLIALFCSVAIPHALSRHAGEAIIASHARFLVIWRRALAPLTGLMYGVDRLVAKLAGVGSSSEADEKVQELEQEILSVVEEGEKEGVVDETDREMITSVIEFRDTTAGQIMTSRAEIVAVPVETGLRRVKEILEESGHSRLPVYEGSLERVVGVLYARDLLKYVGEAVSQFDARAVMRQPLYVPKTRNLRDLLEDFRAQKIHIAIVKDEYGATAGLVTIEDVLEELVGDISDEHEPSEMSMLKRLSDTTAEADARIYIHEFNRLLGLEIPEDAGYETLGGFLSTAMGRIPPPGAVYEHAHVRYTILDAEPQRINRVRVEVMPQPAAAPTGL